MMVESEKSVCVCVCVLALQRAGNRLEASSANDAVSLILADNIWNEPKSKCQRFYVSTFQRFNFFYVSMFLRFNVSFSLKKND